MIKNRSITTVIPLNI